MAFDPKTFLKEYQQTQQIKPEGGFNPTEFLKKNFPTPIGGLGGKGKYDSSQELYNLANQSGLKDKADRILSEKGEEAKKIFSGGFISDIFDSLNALQYGVVGVMKGKGFAEGVKTRQSWSDKDALGDKGLPGVIGGLALDIASDPLTYIAPWTIGKKIPAAVKGVSVARKAFEESKTGSFLARKFIYRFGQDPIYKEAGERSIKNIVVGDMNIKKLVEGVIDIPKEKAAQLLTKDETGRFIRKPLEELKGVLTNDELFNVSKAYSILDDLGKQAVDLKLLSKGKWEENLGEYIKNAYTEYELKKGTGIFDWMKKGVKGIKSRVKGLTPEKMKELGQIDNPAYLLFKSMTDLSHDIENTKLFNTVAKQFGKDVAQEGFKQLPITRRLFTTATGEKIQLLSKVKNLNQQLKPAFNSLKQTFKADKATLSEIHGLEKELEKFSGLRQEEFYKFFQEGQKITKEIPAKTIIKGAGKLPEHLRIIGEKTKPFKTLDDLMKSDVGISLEKLYREGVLERSGFKDAVFVKGGKEIKTTGLKQFFNFVKKPFKQLPEKTKEIVAKENIDRLIELQKGIERLSAKTGTLKEIDKRSINDSYRFLEDTINKIQMEKGELFEQIGKVKLGELSGKYVPNAIFDDIQEITRARSEIEKGLGKVMATWKFGKVILNPATHARNILSNRILNWWKLGLGPWRADIDVEVIRQMTKGGKYIEEAKSVGYSLNTYAANEIKDILLKGDGIKGFGKAQGKAREIAEKFANIYQGEENYAKLSAFIFKRKAGLGIEDAWKAAESATFNYAQVTPFVRRVRESLWGIPFLTFTVKATPIAIETALKHPGRVSVFGKIKNDIENLADIKETQRERASEPSWIRDGFYIKLPMKDKYGRSSYFDLTYILPFGDLMSGNYTERAISRETGLPESLPSAAMQKAPFINIVRELARNQDFYGDKIWKNSDPSEKQLGDIMRHLTKFYSPPLVSDQIPGGYMSSGEKRIKGIRGALTPPEQIKQQRTLMQELLRNVGMKIQPIDADIQETYMEWEKKKALKNLLEETGILKEFEINYVPKK